MFRSRVSKKGKLVALFLWKLLKRYLSNCSIHGVRYLVEDNRHWTERLFWLICCGLSWWGCFLMIFGVFTDFSNRQIATTVETNYLTWRAELPSIHVCYPHSLNAEAYIRKTWKKLNSPSKLVTMLNYGYVSKMSEPHDSASFAEIGEALHVPCEEVFDSCMWNDRTVNCCAIFHPLWTPRGRCHSANSIFTESLKDSAIEDDTYFFRNPISSGVFKMIFRERKKEKESLIFILDKFGIPTVTTGIEKKLDASWRNKMTNLDIVQQPTYNEEGVRMTAIEMRNCRFSNEKEHFQYYEFYSYDACLIEITLKNMIDQCGCVCHLFPHHAQMQVCDYEGLACLLKASALLSSPSNLTCIADCEETTFEMHTTTNVARTNNPEGYKNATVNVHLPSGPTLRYRRYVVHSKLDLVVAVGSALGLFVGASILSLVEIPYWLIIRSFDVDDDDDDDDNEEVHRTRRQDD